MTFRLADYSTRSPAAASRMREAILARTGDIIAKRGPKITEAEVTDLERATELVGNSLQARRIGALLDGGTTATDGFSAQRFVDTRGIGSGAGLGGAPVLAPTEDQLHGLHEAMLSRKEFRTEISMKSTGIAANLVPTLAPGIAPQPLEPTRVLDHIPAIAMDGPIVRYLQHNSTTGAPTTVAPGGLKPEISFGISHIDVAPTKIAAHTSVTDEDLADYGEFATYVSGALTRALIDVENAQLLLGGGTGTDILGLVNQTGALTRAVNTGASEIGLDTVEQAIADLRVGPAFAQASVAVLHPTTFSKLRRSKDSTGRYYLNPDPTGDEARQLWGLPVVLTTEMTAGKALVADMSQAARAHIRQGIVLQSTPFNADDWTHNLTRFRVEERIALAVPRPAALMVVTGL